MQPTNPNPTGSPFPSNTSRPPGIFGTRIPSSVAFAIGVLLFFLPFAEVKCNGSAMAQNTGLGIAIGSQWKEAGSLKKFGNEDSNGPKAEKEKKKQDPNLYAIAALGLGVLGLVFSFANNKAGGLGGLVTGLLSAGALIGLMIDLKNSSQLKSPDLGGSPDKDTMGFSKLGNIQVTLDFTPWFYIAVIAFLAAAFFAYKRLTTNKS